jgi:non-ribosomal peptide synthase protein (TIGR01720 family)
MDVFRRQTVAELAAAAAAGRPAPAEQGPVTGPVPLTPVQHWLFEQRLADVHHYNQAFLLEPAERLDPARLERALQALVAHHDALRLRFRAPDGAWAQEIAPVEAAVPLRYLDLSARPEAEHAGAIAQAAAEAQTSLDLARGPLVRATLFDGGPGRAGRLLLVVHHLAVDGVSWRILLEDLQAAYAQAAQGPVALPPKTTSFKAWAERLAEHASASETRAEAPYWREVALAPRAPLPVDLPDGVNTAGAARSVVVSLDRAATERLLRSATGRRAAEVNDLLLAALAVAFRAWTGRDTLALDLEGHGREPIVPDVDVTRTVGWFTSLFPVHLDLSGAVGHAEALAAVQRQLRRVPRKGIGYGLLRHLDADASLATLRRAPPRQVSFNYLGQFDEALTASSFLRLAPEPAGDLRSPRGLRPHLIEVSAVALGGRLHTTFLYAETLHRRRTIERVAEAYADALRALVADGPGVAEPVPAAAAAVARHEMDDALREIEFD